MDKHLIYSFYKSKGPKYLLYKYNAFQNNIFLKIIILK